MHNEHVKLLGRAKSSWVWPIYVPSYTRGGTAPFLNLLQTAPASIQRRVHIVVRREERKLYEKHYPWATTVLVRRPGLGPARTQALEDALERGYERIVMFDDDIRHLSLLERIARDGKPDHTRRYSTGVSGIAEPMLLVRSLAVACRLADGVFEAVDDAVYGAARNALFSGDVDTSIGATLNKGTFPASVMFYDVTRMENFELPKRFHMHGEDVAFAMDVMTRGQQWFTMPVVAFDQDGNIETTIPLDPTDPEARRVDIENAAIDYPDIHPFLRESMKNKAGGVMRVGVNWRQWYKATDSEPVEIPLAELL
ncbi:glycosyltransferase [Microbacterium phage YuuY]|nr:glycosyltransferase [Microbacterium phage YuuY]